MKNSQTKISALLFIVAGISAPAISQNLVTNPAMEGKCVKAGYAEIIKTQTWTNANGGTVDLFDRTKPEKCHPVNGIPKNYMGTQAASTPNTNYAGFTAFYDDGSNRPWTDSTRFNTDGYKRYTEYLQAELTEPMVAGKVYNISFKVSLAENSGRAASCIGALLTPAKVEQKSNTFLSQKPQFISHRVIKDSLNWVTMYGAYIAEGGEKFLTIGCFKDEYFQLEKVVSPMENDSRKAYYYVSDVSVTPYVPTTPDLDAILFGVDFIELIDLQFATGSSEITPAFYPQLDGIASWMNNHTNHSFFIAGYTDKTGTDAINDPLSVKRAESVKNYLVQKGVKESNLVTKGFGSNNPIEYRIKSSKNRRVEIYLYSVSAVSAK